MYRHLRCEFSGRSGTVTLARPEVCDKGLTMESAKRLAPTP
jgi:hypothetical protein